MGPNRTGIGTSPLHSKEAIKSAEEGVPNPSFDTSAHHASAVSWARSVSPIGTMPPPASMKGAAKSMVQAIKGKHATAFIDLLGERLAFERTGVRLYEALLCRFDAADLGEGSPTRAQLEHIRNEELQHFDLLNKAIQKLGADPTTVTPSADVTGVAGMGLLGVLSDARATFTEGLKAILIAELADNDAWNSLAHIAKQLGQDDMAADFRQALEEEHEHLASVRAWLDNAVQAQIGFEPQAVAPAPEQPQPGV
ncbi:MAG: ferritin-like domain-containing protein [Deltaproteobacteria bacterium]|nr:ferritin-like domain-containing protein [Deltaproteobacteria bacterium]